MSSFHIIDATLNRVKHFNPDLDLDILFHDEHDLQQNDLKVEATHVRSALVARVADIVNQNGSQTSAMDAAVAMIEILIGSFNGYGDIPGNGHKHAMQAIGLLASSRRQFDIAVDLFFDLVDRFCAQSRQMRPHASAYSATFDRRMMQNYDQTFVKTFLSKHWSLKSRDAQLNLNSPLERIKSLRRDYEPQDLFTRIMTFSASRDPATSMFSDSVKVLQMMQRKQATAALRARVSSSSLQSTALGAWKVPKYRRSKDTIASSSDESAYSYEDNKLPVAYEVKVARTCDVPPPSGREKHATVFYNIAEKSIRFSWYDSSTSLDSEVERATDRVTND